MTIEETMAKMDAAGAEAGKELAETFEPAEIRKVGAWLDRHWRKAGYKRLVGELLVQGGFQWNPRPPKG